MGKIIYNFIVGLYNLLLFLNSLYNSKAQKIIHGRRETFQRVSEFRKEKPDQPAIWFHCASLGEFEQGRPVMEALKKNYPHYAICLSFFSSSGYEIQKDYEIASCVFYLPADTKGNAVKLIDMIAPQLVVFVKYEFWYHFISNCQSKGIPVVSISTILRSEQIIFKGIGSFYRHILRLFDHFFVQDSETAEILYKIGIREYSLSGDTRFDRVIELNKKHYLFPEVERFIQNRRCIVLGSSWKPDIDIWANYINDHGSNLKFIIAPHNIEQHDLLYIEKRLKARTIRHSQLKSGVDGNIPVMIIDNIGMLSSLYYYAYIAYVGGAFSEGLHNILEPATYGIPVIMGKSKLNVKYREATDLAALGGAFEIADRKSLNELMNRFLKDHQFYNFSADKAGKYVRNQSGATKKIMNYFQNILK